MKNFGALFVVTLSFFPFGSFLRSVQMMQNLIQLKNIKCLFSYFWCVKVGVWPIYRGSLYVSFHGIQFFYYLLC